MAIELPLGDRVYLDKRCDSYVWRGRIGGKSVRKAIRHPVTGVVATTNNMTKTEAKRIARDMTTDAETGGNKYFGGIGKGGKTVAQAWALYLKRGADKLASAPEKLSHWRNHIEPQLGSKLLTEVTRWDCASIIDRALTAAHARNQNGNAALNLQKNMKAFFAWCADGGYGATGLEASPMSAMKTRPIDVKKTKRPSRALAEQQLIWFFQAQDRFINERCRADAVEQRKRSAQATEALLRAMSPRRNEMFCAKWSWLRDDGLHIPKTKVGYALLVPLPPSLRALFGDRPAEAKDDDLIWGAESRHVAKAIERIRVLMTEIATADGFNGDFAKEFFDEQRTERNLDFFTLHDFRDTGKKLLGKPTGADEQKRFSPETVKAMLNHREGGVAAVYNAEIDDEDYLLPQRRAATVYLNEVYDALKEQALSPVAIAA